MGSRWPRWRPDDISAWFADEFAQEATQAGREASGLSLDDAWELDSVVTLVADHDLLWHAAEELTGRVRHLHDHLTLSVNLLA